MTSLDLDKLDMTRQIKNQGMQVNRKKTGFFFRNFKLKIFKKINVLKSLLVSRTHTTFLIKVTQFEKTGSLNKIFVSLGNLIIAFHIRD